ncbi:MAG: hypothetical protein H6Q69_2405 [Firmicutes bacterium]|nr:hypothetical protein [Bacillota bacterium]
MESVRTNTTATPRKFAILRWINYKESSMECLKRKLDYIADPKSSPAQFQKGFFISSSNAMHGMEVIKRRFRCKGTRNFKHIVGSYGVDITPEKAFNVSCEIAKYYGRAYPTLLCVHTNIPHRIHWHAILGTWNIKNGKRFEQSPDEFERFRNFFNEVLLGHNLPPLKHAVVMNEPTVKIEPYSEEIDGELPMINQYVLPIQQPVVLNGIDPVGTMRGEYCSFNPDIYKANFYQGKNTQYNRSNVVVNCNIDVAHIVRETMVGMQKINMIKKERG